MTEYFYSAQVSLSPVRHDYGVFFWHFRGVPRRLASASVFLLWVIIFLLSWAPEAAGQEEDFSEDNLIELSLDELLNVEITSVAKKSQKRTEAAAAIYVLTAEDIRRSGATNIPDLLRTVPGLSVARIDANKWSVSARGSAGRFANKLLVLIDGRSIYTPFFSGVYWEANDVMLEDVARIEIIRGPGGTLWGANAVNGVINIITKGAKDTQGGLLVVGGGTEEQGFSSLRYGGKVGDTGHYRIYGKFNNRDEGGNFPEFFDPLNLGLSVSGGEANDDWWTGQGGFRMDLDISDEDTLTLQGDVHRTRVNQTNDLGFFAPPILRRTDSSADNSGMNLLARWNRQLSKESDLQLQFFYDYYHSDSIVIDEQRHTFDLEFQHRFPAGKRHEIIWGLGIRHTRDDFENTDILSLSPARRNHNLLSAFIQDEITLTDTLKLTVGTKIEHNGYSGFEYQPSARMAWMPNERHTLWGAVSRAVRTPSRADHDLRLLYAPVAPNTFIISSGNGGFDSEELFAVELGYRFVVSDTLALDLATFYNSYDNLRYHTVGPLSLETIPPPDHFVLPTVASNDASADGWGIELAADYTPKPWWLVRLSYTFFQLNVVNPQFGNTLDADTPQNQVALQNRLDLPHNVEFDTTLRFVGELEDLNIDDYFTLDARLAWRPREDLEIAIVGQNLLDSERFEFLELVHRPVSTGLQRSVYGKVTWKF